MIVQDSLTGALHQVPDQVSGYSGYADYGDVVYDGYGNPLGRFGGIFDDIGRTLRSAVSNIPLVGPAISNLLPGGAGGPPIPPTPPIPGLPFPSPATMFPGMMPFRPPMPAGWVRPSLPYTGLGPKRLYMRCAVWPGPRDMVPAYAQNAAPGLLPGTPPGPMPMPYHHRRHHRRRR
jgi:hypothetical protein